MKYNVKLLIYLLVFLLTSISTFAAGKSFTILHTNDLHSHLLGFSPNIDYTPLETNNDLTRGGWARLATAIKDEQNNRDNPVLILDAGDFLMGSLFHMVCREHALELTLMSEMGFDAITLGNHEFDLRPDGLARILITAHRNGKVPAIVASNLLFNQEDDRDDTLEEVYNKGYVKPYTVLEKQGIKFGIFGLVGADAAEVAPFASPVKFDDILISSKRMVQQLKEVEKVDVVICLSHSGLSSEIEKSEDVILAKEVPGIDIIISGHTHTQLEEPIVANDTIIVQTGAYGYNLGVLDVELESGKVRVKNYSLREIDDSIKGDTAINDKINDSIGLVNREVLKDLNLKFDQVLVETEFDLKITEAETNLGNLITDALRWATDQAEYDPADPSSRVQIAVQSNGVIRDHLLKGQTGKVIVNDLFRVVPLGVGMDETLSYPLVSFYVKAEEIKKTSEILTTIYPLKGSDYFLQFSGLKIEYNPNRMFFDRVTKVFIENLDGSFEQLDVSTANKKLYKVTSNIYNATFLKIIGGFTNNILVIVPKDKQGNPISDLETVRVDGDRNKPGIQEVKDWSALMNYVQTFDDIDGNGIPEIPARYKTAEGRQIIAPSINPINLLWGGSYVTWITFGVIVLLLLILFLIIYIPVRVYKRRKSR
ncbi:bifunctional metallophosphatase/5'-nucleotidase [bacterium]|nr:bifunctional metallophosphatase/5'-nucleotidase [bacterium]